MRFLVFETNSTGPILPSGARQQNTALPLDDHANMYLMTVIHSHPTNTFGFDVYWIRTSLQKKKDLTKLCSVSKMHTLFEYSSAYTLI